MSPGERHLEKKQLPQRGGTEVQLDPGLRKQPPVSKFDTEEDNSSFNLCFQLVLFNLVEPPCCFLFPAEPAPPLCGGEPAGGGGQGGRLLLCAQE